MKLIYNMALIATVAIGISCGPKKQDAPKEAEKQNELVFDDKKLEVDHDFAVKAIDGGLLEVKLGQLAQTKASSSQVKMFGKMMVDDHSKANEELKTLAITKSITLPMELGKDFQKDYDELAAKNGKEFDEAYMAYMVRDHREDLVEFKKEAEEGVDTELKVWAAQKAIVLQGHLEKALETQTAIGPK